VTKAKLEEELEKERRKAWAAPNGPKSREAIHRVKELRREIKAAA
jgi:hypothetical protein